MIYTLLAGRRKMTKNKCYRCRAFDRYYIREVKRFSKTDCGWCCEKVAVVKAQGTCEKFEARKLIRKSRFFVEVALSDIMTDISALRNIIEEERRENEEV